MRGKIRAALKLDRISAGFGHNLGSAGQGLRRTIFIAARQEDQSPQAPIAAAA
jgi:hypothetical protein